MDETKSRDETYGAIPLKINSIGLQCSTEELVELKLNANEQHIKIQFDDGSSNCPFCVCPCGGCWCQKKRDIALQKAVITNTHLIIKRDVFWYSCCWVKWSNSVKSIPLQNIEKIAVKTDYCVKKCHALKTLDITFNDGIQTYDAYKHVSSLSVIALIGVSDPEYVSKVILSRRDNIRAATNDDKPETIALNKTLKSQIGTLIITYVVIVLVLVLWVDYILVIPELNTTLTILLDRILILCAIIHVFIAIIIFFKHSITASNYEPTARSTFPLKIIKSKSLPTYIFVLGLMLIFLIYRLIFLVFNINGKQCSMHAANAMTLHITVVMTAITVTLWQSDWIRYGRWNVMKIFFLCVVVFFAALTFYVAVVSNIYTYYNKSKL